MKKRDMSVKEFLATSAAGGIDYADFSRRFMADVQKANKRYHLLVTLADQPAQPSPSLYGLPVSAKDCICVEGVQSAAGSRILEGYRPTFDATVVARVKKEGGVAIGKTQQDEFGFGTFSVNSGYGIPKNPLDPTRSCGGSSGGAAGLVAALDQPHVALAESTGGSISAPAAFCGVVGLTPTYGLVSRYGLIDYANSLDKIGAIGKRVYDVALLLSVIAGHDSRDSTSLTQERRDYTAHTEKRNDLKGVKIAVPKEYFSHVDKNVEKQVSRAIATLEDLGAACTTVSLPSTKYALAAYYIIATSEASTNLARYCGMRYGLHLPLEGNFNEYFAAVRSKGFGDEAKRRIILGTFARMSGYRKAYYLRAMQVRTVIIQDFKKIFRRYDVIAAPTMPILPPKFSEIKKLKPLEHYQMDVLTVPANLAGIPHISVPCKPKTPVGLHVLGDHLAEPKLIEIAGAFERAML
ncbi:MAG: Asp-tRNA(Asn)/Glu-tRNA(Gln) amidotransferase subunit GatA [Candidatus Aenigmarchaeota archaeon]|nr:Asp-tRNA(Asn)/Glu-tRNA(Gln) amidotransferase subunit GatA [Candidatus Aenigmarchaeota archaeon]